jgi:hypothetical protein
LGVGPPPKTIAGNHPRRVKPEADGRIVLAADDAEIYGDSLLFESHYRNLGYWASANDRAAWTFEVSEPGKYAVWLDWACANDTAGNLLEINLGGQQIHYPVSGTGTWDDYAMKKIGDVVLTSGASRLEVRPAAAPRNAVLDLRRIELRPHRPVRKTTSTAPAAAADACSCDAVAGQ